MACSERNSHRHRTEPAPAPNGTRIGTERRRWHKLKTIRLSPQALCKYNENKWYYGGLRAEKANSLPVKP